MAENSVLARLAMRVPGNRQDAMAQAFPERTPSADEGAFFQRRPEVAGYAADDGSVVLNPTTSDPDMKAAILLNERIRQSLKDAEVAPFDIEDHQHGLSAEYDQDPAALRKSIVARILTHDKSLAPYSRDQVLAAKGARRLLGRGR